MKKKLLNLIKKSSTSGNAFNSIKNIFDLYEQLQYTSDLNSIFKEINNWFDAKYNISSIKVNLYNSELDYNHTIFHNGDDFEIDHELTRVFIINVDLSLNALILVHSDNKKNFDKFQNDNETLDSLFFMISPIIKDAIVLNELANSSLKDNITGFYNRKFLDIYLKKQLPIAKQNNEQISFLLVEVDHFKAVIDEFDYEIGDEVLIKLAKTLHANIKEKDIIVKLTGYEFLVILTNSNDFITNKIATNMVQEFSKCKVPVNVLTNQTLQKTICIGYSIYPDDSDNINDVIKNANIALDEAQNIGRSQILRFEKSQESTIDFF